MGKNKKYVPVAVNRVLAIITQTFLISPLLFSQEFHPPEELAHITDEVLEHFASQILDDYMLLRKEVFSGERFLKNSL